MFLSIFALSSCSISSQKKDETLTSVIKTCRSNLLLMQSIDVNKYQVYNDAFTIEMNKTKQFYAMENKMSEGVKQIIAAIHIQKIRELCFTINTDVTTLLIKNAR